ncbi:MAG: O-antigen polymerase [Chthoniobacterales bacterium]
MQLPIAVIIAVVVSVGPIIIWGGGANPQLLGDFAQPWGAPWALVTAGVLAALIFILPLCWMLVWRTLDLIALALAQSGLLMLGYYFLDITAFHIENAGSVIVRQGGTVLLINSVGFALLFLSMVVTYTITMVSRARLRPLIAPPEAYDVRLRPLLYVMGGCALLVIALPMPVTGTIPMLAADPMAARYQMLSSDVTRAFYNLGTAVLPFIVGGLLTGIFREPRRLFGLDGWLAGSIVVVQILSGQRLPIAVTMLVAATLISLERKWPRWLVFAAFIAYLFMFTGVSGFTAILRKDRSVLSQGNVLKQSLDEAFLGDNLIDLRDAAWVFGYWDKQPLMGTTYLGGLVAMVPSGIFPQKHEWHLGLTGIRIVGWDPEKHFGIRITFFGESYLNFGWAGVMGFAVIMGCLFGTLLRQLHLLSLKRPPCLVKNLRTVMLMQMCLPLSNTSDAFTFWSMCVILLAMWVWIDLPVRLAATAQARAKLPLGSSHA